MDKKNKELTRDDEIVKASIDYDIENGLQNVVGCNSVLKDYEYIYFNQNRAFVAGAKWADRNPRKGLVDIDKVCEWLEENLDNYVYNKGFVSKNGFIKSLRMAEE